MTYLRTSVFIAPLLLAGCAHNVTPHLTGPFPQNLSEWRLFTGAAADLKPNRGVVPYDLNTTLFTDYAVKHRYVWMPPGTAAIYNASKTFVFPKGAILVKTFGYPDAALDGKLRLIETRLLVNGEGGWFTLPYIWNRAQTDAVLDTHAAPLEVNWRRPQGGNYAIQYAIPNADQCRQCHDRNKITGPLGPTASHLNRDFAYDAGTANQLTYWTRIGYLKGAPDPALARRQAVWDDVSTGSVEQRARAYLDVNCAHCHRAGGDANDSGLYLSDQETDPMRLGIFRTPVESDTIPAGMSYDVVPGRPDLSILAYRMSSEHPKLRMPDLGRTLVHKEAVALVRRWIAEQPSAVSDQRSATPR